MTQALLWCVIPILGAVALGFQAYTLFCVPSTSPTATPQPVPLFARVSTVAGTLWLIFTLMCIVSSTYPRAGWVIAAILLFVSVGFSLRLHHWNNRFAAFGFGLLALSISPFVGATGGMPGQDYTANAAFIFTIAFVLGVGVALAAFTAWMLKLPSRGEVADFQGRRRVRILLTICALFAALGAAVLLWFRVRPADWIGVGLTTRGLWVGTTQEKLIGFDVDGPWSVPGLVTNWHFDLIFGTIAILLGVGYALGVWAIRRRGDTWSSWRFFSWEIGCVALLLTVASGVNTYAYSQMSVHMALHMALNLYIPAALVLGGPVTLLLRAVHPSPYKIEGRKIKGPREWVLGLVHSRYVRVLSHPLVAITMYILTLYVLYFTPLLDACVANQWGHIWMNVHFLLSGYLFYWPVCGIDPGPNRLPHLARFGMLFIIMPFHAFFGVALMMMTAILAGDFYTSLGVLQGHELLADDQRIAGAIAWISGELPLIAVVLALGTQWWKSDVNKARTADRREDLYGSHELADYNKMLRDLSEQRR